MPFNPQLKAPQQSIQAFDDAVVVNLRRGDKTSYNFLFDSTATTPLLYPRTLADMTVQLLYFKLDAAQQNAIFQQQATGLIDFATLLSYVSSSNGIPIDFENSSEGISANALTFNPSPPPANLWTMKVDTKLLTPVDHPIIKQPLANNQIAMFAAGLNYNQNTTGDLATVIQFFIIIGFGVVTQLTTEVENA